MLMLTNTEIRSSIIALLEHCSGNKIKDTLKNRVNPNITKLAPYMYLKEV